MESLKHPMLKLAGTVKVMLSVKMKADQPAKSLPLHPPDISHPTISHLVPRHTYLTTLPPLPSFPLLSSPPSPLIPSLHIAVHKEEVEILASRWGEIGEGRRGRNVLGTDSGGRGEGDEGVEDGDGDGDGDGIVNEEW